MSGTSQGSEGSSGSAGDGSGGGQAGNNNIFGYSAMGGFTIPKKRRLGASMGAADPRAQAEKPAAGGAGASNARPKDPRRAAIAATSTTDRREAAAAASTHQGWSPFPPLHCCTYQIHVPFG